MELALNEYQIKAEKTAIYTGRGTFEGLTYCTLKLNGEAGEVAEKVGKAWRDDDQKITSERRQAILIELGDVLWYVANLASELGAPLELVAKLNLQKLADRKTRNKLHGEGDER